VYNLNYHIIWCTKYRRKVLAGSVGDDLKTILHAISKEHGYRIPHVEIGLDDRIHLFVSAPPKISVSSIVKQLKGTSSLRLFAMHPELKSEYWKRRGERSLWPPSYFAESIGSVNEQAVAKCIDDQRAKGRDAE
jgi:putative transposase